MRGQAKQASTLSGTHCKFSGHPYAFGMFVGCKAADVLRLVDSIPSPRQHLGLNTYTWRYLLCLPPSVVPDPPHGCDGAVWGVLSCWQVMRGRQRWCNADDLFTVLDGCVRAHPLGVALKPLRNQRFAQGVQLMSLLPALLVLTRQGGTPPVSSGCVQTHPLGIALEPLSESEIRSEGSTSEPAVGPSSFDKIGQDLHRLRWVRTSARSGCSP